MFENLLYTQLTRLAKKYLGAHPEVQLVAIVGTNDKAITRQAVGTVLAQEKRVRLHEHMAHSRYATPLAILGIMPPDNPKNLLNWLAVFRAAARRIKEPTTVDVIVQELPLRRPGDMREYGRYLRPHVALITSIAAEHIDAFGSLDAVAQEYLAIGDMSELIIVNRDRVDSSFAQYEHNANITTYGASDRAEYWVEADDIYGPHGTPIEIRGPEYVEPLQTNAHLVGTNALLAALAGAVVGTKLGVSPAAISKGISRVATLPGRMNPLHGIGQTLIIDDTYRAHPDAAIAGLQALYEFDTAPQRIAILSSFPDLGELSGPEHKRVGKLCNPDLLAWVIVVGEDAKTHLAPVARKNGCQVKVCKDAIEAGQFTRSVTEHGAVILVEGSSKETYLEETTKILCDVSEESKLVRQGSRWRALKNAHFSRFN